MSSSGDKLNEVQLLSLAEIGRIDDVCDEFAAAWRRGERPAVEEFVGRVPDSLQVAVAKELLRKEFALHVEAGQRLGPSDYSQRLPSWPKPLRVAYSSLMSVLFSNEINEVTNVMPFFDTDEHSQLERAAEVHFGGELPVTKSSPPKSASNSLPKSPPPKSPTKRRPPEVGPVPQQIGHYRILKQVGRGGMGVVLRAVDTKLDREVAIKMLLPQLASDETARTRFMREAKAAAAVRHENVVTIFSVEDVGGVPFLVMELIEGDTLKHLIRQHKRLPLAAILRFSIQMAEGLAVAHARGLVHRDIKPANILLRPETGSSAVADPHNPLPFQVKITDFGLARISANTGLTQTGMIMGTPQYMSPEQAEGRKVDHRSDLFSLGGVMYAMCTGQSAFEAESVVMVMRKVCDRPHPPVSNLAPETPDWLIAIIDRLLAKSPDDRFQSAGELLDALRPRMIALQAGTITLVTCPGEPGGVSPRTTTELQCDARSQSDAQVLSAAQVRGLTPSGSPGFDHRTQIIANEATVLLPKSLSRAKRSARIWMATSFGLVAAAGLGGWAMWSKFNRPDSQNNLVTQQLVTSTPSAPTTPSVNDQTTAESPTSDSPKPTEPAPTSKPAEPPPTPNRVTVAREAAALAGAEKRWANVITESQLIFDQKAATVDDSLRRATAYFALAEADESPAENYGRAAADFAQAELPREQFRALSRQGRWLLDHNFAKKAVAPLRQSVDLQNSPEARLSLCQALLAADEVQYALDETLVALTEAAEDPAESNTVLATTIARLHYVAAKASVILAARQADDPDQSVRPDDIERADSAVEKHFQEALTFAARTKLDDQKTWQDELSMFRKLPRMVAREEHKRRKARIAKLTQQLADSPTDAAGWLERADLEQKDEQLAAATRHFALGHGLQSLEFARAGKFEAAAASADQAAKFDADSVLANQSRALIAVAAGRDADAIAALDAALLKLGSVKGELPLLASAGDTERTGFTLRWQLLADRAAAHVRLTRSVSEGENAEGHREKALADFDAAIAAFPQKLVAPTAESPITPAHRSLARLHFDRAAVVEASAMSNNESSPDLIKLADAEKSLLAAVSLNPEESRFALTAGQNLLRQVRRAAPGTTELLERATSLLATTTKLNETEPEAHFALGDCWLLSGQSESAQKAFDRAVEHSANSPVARQVQFRLNQSVAYLRPPRDANQALAAADKAISLERTEPAAHFARGTALRALDRANDAIAAFHDTLALQPKHVGALLGRSQLIIEHKNATPKQIEQAQQDIELALTQATIDEQRAEAYYVRSLNGVRIHVASGSPSPLSEPALLNALRDVLKSVKLIPANAIYRQAAKELAAYATKYNWSDAKRKSEFAALQPELKSVNDR